MKIYCIVPAFNEEGNIEKLTRQLTQEFHTLNIAHKIFLVVQGDDGSQNLVAKLRKKNPAIDSMYFPFPLGIGKAYCNGFNRIDKKFSHVLTLDADLNHDPADIGKFVKAMKTTGSDIVIGSRFMKGGRFDDTRAWKRFISTVVNSFIRILMNVQIHDVTSGYRLMKREVVEKITPTLKESGYPFYMEFILKAKQAGFSFSEIPITYFPRKWGKSKMGKIRTLIDYIKFSPNLFFHS